MLLNAIYTVSSIRDKSQKVLIADVIFNRKPKVIYAVYRAAICTHVYRTAVFKTRSECVYSNKNMRRRKLIETFILFVLSKIRF